MLLATVKQALRVSHSALDLEIMDLIDASRLDLKQSGVSEIKTKSDKDPLIKRAIILYCKFHFHADSEEAQRYQESYDSLKIHLALAGDYREQDIEVNPLAK